MAFLKLVCMGGWFNGGEGEGGLVGELGEWARGWEYD